MKFKLLTAALLFSLSQWGCQLTNTNEEKQDSASSAESMGGELNENLAKISDAESLLGSTQSFTSFSNTSFPIPTQNPNKVLAKSGELVIKTEINIDSSLKNEGTVLVSVYTKTDSYEKRDSLWVVWDEKARDTIKDNENIRKVHSITTTNFGHVNDIQVVNDDEDSIVNGEAKYANRAKATFIVRHALGYTETTVIRVTSGADKNFDTEIDNQIIATTYEKKWDNGGIERATFSDIDGDGYINNPASSASSLAGVQLYQENIIKTASLYMVVRIDKAGEKGKLVSISGQESFINGRVNQISIINQKGDSIISAKDTATLTIKTTKFAAGDSIKGATVQLVFDVGVGLHDSTDNKFLEIHTSKDFAYGPVQTAEFHFVASEPIPQGEEAKSGTVNIRVQYKDGREATLVGTFSEGQVEATVTDADGNEETITYAPNGHIIKRIIRRTAR